MKSLLTESLKGFSIAEWPLCRHCNPDGFNVLGLKETQNGTKDANLRIERTEGDNEGVQNLPVQPTWNDLLDKVEEEMASDNCDKVSGVRGDGVLFGNKYDIITRGSISVIFHVESQEMLEVFITIVQLDGKRKLRWFITIGKEDSEKTTGTNYEKVGVLHKMVPKAV
jgi:hypothetical protein